MKFYVAGKWQERDVVSNIMQELRERGHEVTIDWTNHSEGEKGYPVQFAADDIEGVRGCDVFLGIFINDHQYRGALVELGAALAMGKITMIVGGATESCLFTHHTTVQRFATMDLFWDYEERWLRVGHDKA